MVIAVSAMAGCLLSGLGFLLLTLGRDFCEVKVQYSGEKVGGAVPLIGSAADEFVFAPCEESVTANMSKTCEVSVEIPRDMKPPVMLFASLDPFYQNFPPYIQSGGTSIAWPQLTGHFAEGAICRQGKDVDARQAPNGEIMFPCGLAATSVFNDTFHVRRTAGSEDFEISSSNIAHYHDIERMANPSNYGAAGIEWLFERYPDVIPKSQGAKNQRLVDWMRPAALPMVMKKMGSLNVSLRKGEILTLTIDSRFPVSHLNVRKAVSIIALSAVGGRGKLFGYSLLLAGGTCLATAALVLAIESICKRKPGDARFRGTSLRQMIGERSESESSTGSEYGDHS